MKPLPKTCLSKVRVRAGINEPVTVWWSTTEISGGVLRECRHRRTDTHLDSRALSLAHTAEKRHDEVMRLGAWVDRSARATVTRNMNWSNDAVASSRQPPSALMLARADAGSER